MTANDRSTRVMFLSGIGLVGLAILMIVYYWLAMPIETSYGERYVSSEVPLIFPFFVIMSFKPITVIVYLIFFGVLLILEAKRDWFRHKDTRFARLLFLLVAFGSGYEVFWNFFAWFTYWEMNGGSMDALANMTHEYAILPANYNFATKVIFLVFALSLYVSLFLEKVERS